MPAYFATVLLKDISLLRCHLKCSLLPHIRDLSVDIHRGLYVRMAHDTLDHFQIILMLAEPCTERMPEDMA